MKRIPSSAIHTRTKIETDSSDIVFTVSPSGKKLAVVGEKEILIADLNTNGILAKIPIEYRVCVFDFDESESHFFVEERIGKFVDVFSVEKGFGLVKREIAEDFTNSWSLSPRLNRMCIKDSKRRKYELFSISPKKSLNFEMDFESHRHKIDEISGSLIFRNPNQKSIEVVDLKSLTSHIVDDSIDARFFALTSDKKTLFMHNYEGIQFIDYQKNKILRDFHLEQKVLCFYLFVIQPGCLIMFHYEIDNLNQFYIYNQKNSENLHKFQTPPEDATKINSFKEIERKAVYMEKYGEGKFLLKEVELGNICELISTGQTNRKLLKLHMSLERRGLEIKPWKQKRYIQSQPLS